MAAGDRVGTLVVDLRTNTAKFTQGFDKAQGRVRKFSQGIGKVKAAVIGLAGAGGLGLLVKATLDTAVALDLVSQKLGITTEALTGLRLAADQTGVSSNTLDMGLQRMTRRVAEAAQGTGEAKDALKELGLDAKLLAQQSPDKIFFQIAQAMEQVTTEGDRVRLSFKLFDSEGVALKNTLALGVDGLAKAREEAVGFGKALSDVDSAAIMEFNEESARAKAAVSGLAQDISISLAPVMERMARGTVKFVQALRDLFGIRTQQEDLNALFAERLELQQELNAVVTTFSPTERAEAQKRIEEIADEMNAIIARRDLTLQSYVEQREARRAVVEDEVQLSEDSARKRLLIEQKHQDTVTSLKMSAFQHAATLIRSLAPESEKAALVALAIEKGLAATSVAIQTKVASMRAVAELGPVAGPPVAGQIEAWGAASVAFIIGAGLAQAGAIGSGPGLSGGGIPATVAEQTPSEDFFDPFTNTPTQSGSITINVNGVVTDEIVQDLIVPAVQDAVDNRDVILIRGDSANGLELLA